MPASHDDSKRDRRTAKRTLALGLPLVVIAGTGVGYAYFTGSGSGSGTASVGSTASWAVTGTDGSGNPAADSTALYPGGAPSVLSFRITNSGAGHQGLTSVTVALASDTTSGDIINGSNAIVTGCKATWFTAGALSLLDGSTAVSLATNAYDLAKDGFVTGTSSLSLANLPTSQDACKGAAPKFTVTAG
jgi:hypothetical protein